MALPEEPQATAREEVTAAEYMTLAANPRICFREESGGIKAWARDYGEEAYFVWTPNLAESLEIVESTLRAIDIEALASPVNWPVGYKRS